MLDRMDEMGRIRRKKGEQKNGKRRAGGPLSTIVIWCASGVKRLSSSLHFRCTIDINDWIMTISTYINIMIPRMKVESWDIQIPGNQQ